jgi:cystathionine gamma-synthase
MKLLKPRFETLAIQSTEVHLDDARPATMPIHMSSTFIRNEDGSYNHGLQYGRADNPNRAVLEKSLALLEGGERAFAFGSGMAAISAVFQCMSPGQEVILPNDVYFAAKKLVDQVYSRWGLKIVSVDMSNIDVVKAAITPDTVLIWMETPSNPLIQITDLGDLIALAKSKGIMTAVDNTWPTPVLTRPIEMGADVVIHSTTKYFGGHSDVIGGCVIVKEENDFSKRLTDVQQLGGAVPSPFDCWLVARVIRTLSLRVKAQCDTALKLAQYLEGHPDIQEVLYPGLPSHKGHTIAKKQMENGFGAMMSVLIGGDSKKSLEICNRLQYFTQATSLGGVESLVEHRRSVEGPMSNAPDNLLRVSVGLEHPDDLIADWGQALGT